ncbi:hypothetical protein N7478_004483 [Penicillium angulare]|uniref:uncharacterized protein n=1 Tax=Penicillium angulare TaxID=116970 RepID=UPI0025411FA1|nr:uncharacterized protein N7478_004483 [Penicillium angulare]KAJ5279111.1 hypothetical protein N7478_004483 [Penicillium angulare]
MRQTNTCPDAIYLITYPRTGSNLLLKILNLSEQPDVAAQTKEGYYFHPPLKLRHELGMFDRPLALWEQDYSRLLSQCFKDCFEELDGHLKFANAMGKSLFVKEHAPWLIDPAIQSEWIHDSHDKDEIPMPIENPTILPNEFLRQVSPTFLIRNPIASFPSHYRAMRDSWYGSAETFKESGNSYLKFNMTIRWSRMMYDWYDKQKSLCREHGTNKGPIVLDADDIMTKPEVVIEYCNAVGLDSTKAKFSWKPLSSDKMDAMDPEFLRMKDTLHASDGIRQDKLAAGLSLAKEAVKWKKEFGEAEGAKLVQWVQAAMPDYEYMWARRLTLPN